MSTAVIYTGQARSFRDCYKTQYWALLRHLDNPIIYACVEDDEQAGHLELLREWFERVYIHRIRTPHDLPCPPDFTAAHTPYPLSTPVDRQTRVFYGVNEAYKFFQKAEAECGYFSDTIIKLRPDLYFRSMKLPVLGIGFNDVVSPWWGRYGGINDRMAFMGRGAAKHFFGVYEKMDALLAAGCPMHGESLTAASCEEGGVKVRHELHAWTAFKRMPGHHQQGNWGFVEPDHNANEVLMSLKGL